MNYYQKKKEIKDKYYDQLKYIYKKEREIDK